MGMLAAPGRVRQKTLAILDAMPYAARSPFGRPSMISKYLAAVAATALVAAPVAAAPANPAASLSVAKSVRTGSASAKKNELAGGGVIIALVAAAAVVAGIVIVADDNNSDSN